MDTNLHQKSVAAVKAWQSIKVGRRKLWGDWVVIGEAFQEARNNAMRMAGTNQPSGKGYNKFFGAWLKEYPSLHDIAKSVRGHLLNIMEHLDDVQEWRNRQDDPDAFNDPTTIWRKFTNSSKVRDHKDQKRRDNSPAELIKELKKENEQLKARIQELQEENQSRRSQPNPLTETHHQQDLHGSIEEGDKIAKFVIEKVKQLGETEKEKLWRAVQTTSLRWGEAYWEVSGNAEEDWEKFQDLMGEYFSDEEVLRLAPIFFVQLSTILDYKFDGASMAEYKEAIAKSRETMLSALDGPLDQADILRDEALNTAKNYPVDEHRDEDDYDATDSVEEVEAIRDAWNKVAKTLRRKMKESGDL